MTSVVADYVSWNLLKVDRFLMLTLFQYEFYECDGGDTLNSVSWGCFDSIC